MQLYFFSFAWMMTWSRDPFQLQEPLRWDGHETCESNNPLKAWIFYTSCLGADIYAWLNFALFTSSIFCRDCRKNRPTFRNVLLIIFALFKHYQMCPSSLIFYAIIWYPLKFTLQPFLIYLEIKYFQIWAEIKSNLHGCQPIRKM